MIRTTMRELRTFPQIEDIMAKYPSKDDFLDDWGRYPRQQLAYAAGLYGDNGHLWQHDKFGIVAQVGRTSLFYELW